jgi:hypothetical protein
MDALCEHGAETLVDRAFRRAMFIPRGFVATSWHRAAERAIHPLLTSSA